MFDPGSILAALIRARRAGDERAVNDALTRLAERGFRLQFGSDLPPRFPRPTDAAPPPSGRTTHAE